MSRLSRDKEDAARIEKILDYHGVAIVTLDGMTYDGSVGASLAFTFQSAGAAQYLRELGAKTRRGLRGAHREGKSTGGRCYGYAVVDERTVVEEIEASVVRRIFRMYLDGLGYAVIAQKLNEQRVPAPRTRRALAAAGCTRASARFCATRSTWASSPSASGDGSGTPRLESE